MFPENLLRTPKVFINNGCSGDAASRTAHRWGEQLSTSLLRSHALLLRRGERHIPNGFRSPGGSALSRTHGVLCKTCWTPCLMASPGRDSLCRVAPEGRPPAGAPLADVARPSYRHPSPS